MGTYFTYSPLKVIQFYKEMFCARGTFVYFGFICVDQRFFICHDDINLFESTTLGFMWNRKGINGETFENV